MRRWAALTRESRETYWRSLHAMNGTRVVIALVLLLYLTFDRREHGAGYLLYAETCTLYLAAAVGFGALAFYVRRRFLLQVVVQVLVDIGVISMLYLSGGGARSGLVILYLFPLAGAAILAPLVLSLFSASLVTLFLLGDTVYRVLLGERDTPLLQAGLYGAVFFAIVTVVNRLAAKLIGQEELASQRGIDLRIQQAINQIVIADVEDGILVVGRDGRVFAANPAALFMLGLSGHDGQFTLSEMAALEPVAHAFSAWLHNSGSGGADWQGAQRAAFVTLRPYHDIGGEVRIAAWSGRRDLAAHLKLRFARVDTPDETAERCVIFLQDVTAIENQAQELKLASMGRLTASIAHEVRNPLSAIGHATALLAEDLGSPTHVRLLKIVGDNVTRVNRMVEDILQLSRKVQPNGEPLLLASFLVELKTEFQETHGLRDDIVCLGNTEAAPVRFDGLHLREVLVNLLTNAVRYASGAPCSIRIDVVTDALGRMELHVQDDGPGITPEVRSHLFEPFYTTSSKGTGLGLYLARELCLNNDATLDYEYRFDASVAGAYKASGRFVITFAQPLAV
jgi:two-component system sensor histidine kinase PilS (NtrC family)